MKRQTKRAALAAALTLTVLCGAALAASGDKDDPLVTVSYLEQTVIPDVVSQVESKMETRQKELSQQLSEQIAQYEQEVAQAGAGTGSSASYTLVTLTSGQTMALDVGCEVMLRVGNATVKAATSPALVDVTTGGTVESGTSLTKNHLYMSTIADRTIEPAAETVKLLVRGGYSVT